jgi:hypothetical protein
MLVTCDGCHDQLRQTMFLAAARLRAPAAHRLGDGTRSSALERVGDGQGNCNRCGPVRRGSAYHADVLVDRVRTDDAGVPARGCLAGGDRKRCRAGLMAVILGYSDSDVVRLGGSFMHGTVSAICDIFRVTI